MRDLTVDWFATVDGCASGQDAPAYFGYTGPELDAWIDEQPKVVFSSSLQPPLSWVNTTVVSDDVAVAVPAMKREDGAPMRVIGSLSLVRSLFRLGLVDRLRIMVFPQILGETGQEPILKGLPDIDLRLNATKVLDARLVLLDYSPANGG